MFKITPIIINGVNLTYVSDGDTNDVFYFIGTLNNTTTFTNPQSITSPIIATINTISSGTLLGITDRIPGGFATTDVVNSNVVIDLGNGRSLRLNKYSLRARNIGTTHLRNWKLQSSNDGTTWVDLDTQINNTSLAATFAWVSITVSGITTNYRYFRLLQTGLNAANSNALSLGEMQLYGTYYY